MGEPKRIFYTLTEATTKRNQSENEMIQLAARGDLRVFFMLKLDSGDGWTLQGGACEICHPVHLLLFLPSNDKITIEGWRMPKETGILPSIVKMECSLSFKERIQRTTRQGLKRNPFPKQQTISRSDLLFFLEEQPVPTTQKREEEHGLPKIAERLGLTLNTVKNYLGQDPDGYGRGIPSFIKIINQVERGKTTHYWAFGDDLDRWAPPPGKKKREKKMKLAFLAV